MGQYRWLIDTDDLARVPGVALNAAVLAELQARAALIGAGEDVLARLTRLEGYVADLRRKVDELDTRSSGSKRDSSA